MAEVEVIVIETPAEGEVLIRRVKAQKNDGDLSEFLHAAVGGYFEVVRSEDGKVDFWVNEEGKLRGLPFNQCATELLWQLNPVFIGKDMLVGPIALTGNRGASTTSVPAGTWERLKEMFVDDASVVFKEFVDA